MPTASARPIRVLIADDHDFFRETLRKIFEATEDLEVVGESKNGHMAVVMASTLKPDVVIMDVRMPVMDGIVATSKIVTANPVARVVILTLGEMEDDLYASVQAGARSYLLKGTDAQVIVETIRSVHRGEVVLTPLLLGKLFDSICTQSVGPTPRLKFSEPGRFGERVIDIHVQDKGEIQC